MTKTRKYSKYGNTEQTRQLNVFYMVSLYNAFILLIFFFNKLKHGTAQTNQCLHFEK